MNNELPEYMSAVLLTAHGGIDKLEYRDDVPLPVPLADEVLIRVGAAGVNNTDINTRIGWYSKSISSATDVGGADGFESVDDADASWCGEALQFPRIQGADCCGHIVAVGEGVSDSRIGERVLVRSIQSSGAEDEFVCRTFGSECDGGFAQYAKTLSTDALRIESPLSDIELASFPCAYSTAEGLLERAAVGAETVLVTGASGGVGSAVVQLARRRGARVIAVASAAKAKAVATLGAERVIDRDADLVESLAGETIDVVIDLVAGPAWPQLIEVLRRGGRYATAGAIAGPMVELDVRSLYLKDLTFYGCTYQSSAIFENLVAYIERAEIKPLVAGSNALKDIARAQQDFISKQHTGKLVLVPPQ